MERPTEGAFGAARRVERACVAMRKVRHRGDETSNKAQKSGIHESDWSKNGRIFFC